MMMFETSKHVPKTEKRCCVFKNNCQVTFDAQLKTTLSLVYDQYNVFP